MKQLLTKKRNKKGFTLIELIIVIVIIAILAAIAIPSMIGYIDRARVATAQANCRAVASAAQAAAADGTIDTNEVATLLGTSGNSYAQGTFDVDITSGSSIVTTVSWSGQSKTATWTASSGAITVK